MINNQLAQAFLFCGPRGVGKTTCARILAKTINCFHPTESMEACNECESCTSFNKSASFNIHELDAASNNSVEDIRNLVEQVRIPPQVGKYKVYIIDEVHMLSSSAFNAFLKTLEEPPAYVKFILATTEKHKILPTILSRCQIFDFKRITIDDIANHLAYIAQSEGVTAEPDALHIIAQKADGALRDALSLFDQLVSCAGKTLTYKNVIENLNVLDYDYFIKITDCILSNQLSETLLIINEIIINGFDGQHFIIGMGEHLRNLLVCKDPATSQLLEVGQDTRQKYLDQSGRCQVPFLIRSLDIINRCDLNYKTANNKRLHLELALLQMSALATGDLQDAGQKKKLVMPRAPRPQAAAEGARPATNTAASTPAAAVAVANTSSAATATPQKKEAVATIAAKAKPAIKTTNRPISAGGRKFGRSLSIKALTNQSTQTGTDEAAADEVRIMEPKNKSDFSEQALLAEWKKYIETISNSHPSLYSTLAKRPPVLKADYMIELAVDHEIQKNDVHQNKSKILQHLRQELNNDLISLETVICESQEEVRLYTPDDKYQEMVKKNPVLQSLKRRLELEIDF